MQTEVQTLTFPLFINGEWRPASTGETLDVLNPANGEVIANVAKAGKEDDETAILSARISFDSGIWSKKSPKERADILLQFASKIVIA